MSLNKSSDPVITILIPVFNEESAIMATLQEIAEVSQKIGVSVEIIVINDGSTDGTSALLNEQKIARVIHSSTNRGYGAALKAGLRSATSEWICITDADGSYPNWEIPRLFEARGNADMVVGSRTGKGVNYSWIRRIPKVFLTAYASWLSRSKIPDINSGLRIFKIQPAKKFIHLYPSGFSFTTTITMAFLTNDYEVNYIPVGYSKRVGKSKIQPIRDTLRFTQLIARIGMLFAPIRVLLPLIFFLTIALVASLACDIFLLKNLTDKSVMLFMFFMNTCIFALLADMIQKSNTFRP